MIRQVRYLNGGYCRHLMASIDGRTLRLVRFHAVFLALEHEKLGWIVCDTGYGSRFYEATRLWPWRLYRWATPVTLRGPAAESLRACGLVPADVRHLVITHFHADHIGGLHEFPHARVYHHEDALEPLLGLTPFRQTRAAFLPSLVPNDLRNRGTVLPRKSFVPDAELPFRSTDLLGDGSLKLVDLPGHAPGQLGLAFIEAGGKTLYCADAFWRSEQIEKGVNLPGPVLALQWDRRAYADTIERLRSLRQTGTHRLLACHDERTQQHVAA